MPLSMDINSSVRSSLASSSLAAFSSHSRCCGSRWRRFTAPRHPLASPPSPHPTGTQLCRPSTQQPSPLLPRPQFQRLHPPVSQPPSQLRSPLPPRLRSLLPSQHVCLLPSLQQSRQQGPQRSPLCSLLTCPPLSRPSSQACSQPLHRLVPRQDAWFVVPRCMCCSRRMLPQ